MTKFTKGPWYSAKNGCIKTVDGEITVAQISWMRNEEEEAHNANLIAAAPELFIVLEHCLAWLPGDCSAACEARAAIAKATGEQP